MGFGMELEWVYNQHGQFLFFFLLPCSLVYVPTFVSGKSYTVPPDHFCCYFPISAGGFMVFFFFFLLGFLISSLEIPPSLFERVIYVLPTCSYSEHIVLQRLDSLG